MFIRTPTTTIPHKYFERVYLIKLPFQIFCKVMLTYLVIHRINKRGSADVNGLF